MAGYSGCGKSTFGVWLLRRFRGPKAAVDPVGSAVTDLAGWHSSADPTGRTWPDDAELIRFVPADPYDLDTYNRFYRTVRERITETHQWPCAAVLTDEMETALPAHNPPREGAGLVYRGRKWPSAHIGAATRPFNIATAAKANLTHAAIFGLPNLEDRKEIAHILGIPLQTLEEQLFALPEKCFLWWNQATRRLRPVISSAR